MIIRVRKKIRDWRNRTGIRTQLILAMGILLVSIVAGLMFYSYSSQVNTVMKREKESLSRILELEAEHFDSYLSELEDYSLQLRSDAAFMQILSGSGPLSYEDKTSAENSVRNYFYSRKDIVRAEIFIINHEILFKIDSQRKKVTTQQYYSPQALPDYFNFTAPPAYISMKPTENGLMEITRTIIDSPWKTPIAIVRLLVDRTELEALQTSHEQENETLYIFDQSGNAYFRNGCEQDIFQAVQNRTDRIKVENEYNYNSEYHLVLSSSAGHSGFLLALSKPLSAINSETNRARNRTLVFGLAAIAVALCILVSVSNGLTKPLRMLSQMLQETGAGDFYGHTDLQGSADVIGLSDEVNRMNSNIAGLIDRTYIATINERTARLAALEAQTNPHFLFNTLQAIGAESLTDGNIKVYGMITSLASLLRYTIRGGNLVELRTELEYADKYLKLQKSRFGDRLEYSFSCDEGLRSCSVPKLSLLALTENSIVHGMHGTVDRIELKIGCEVENSSAVIYVTDNGAGIPPEKLQKLTEMIRDDRKILTDSIGLGNLASRLRLIYADSAKLEIESAAEPVRATVIRIRIPMEVLNNVQISDR